MFDIKVDGHLDKKIAELEKSIKSLVDCIELVWKDISDVSKRGRCPYEVDPYNVPMMPHNPYTDRYHRPYPPPNSPTLKDAPYYPTYPDIWYSSTTTNRHVNEDISMQTTSSIDNADTVILNDDPLIQPPHFETTDTVIPIEPQPEMPPHYDSTDTVIPIEPQPVQHPVYDSEDTVIPIEPQSDTANELF